MEPTDTSEKSPLLEGQRSHKDYSSRKPTDTPASASLSLSSTHHQPSLLRSLSIEKGRTTDIRVEFPKRYKDYESGVHISVEEEIRLKRHINLGYAIAIVVGGVTGSGIFVAPTGVTQHAGSLGSTLVIWAAGGVFNLLLTLCYAELSTALPKEGGDYDYVNKLLGRLPAFLCLWVTALLVGPAAAAVMARTVAVHILQMVGMDCYLLLTVLISVLINVSFAWLNALSAPWSARLMSLFSVAKVASLAIIIISGIVNLFSGHTKEFEEPFRGSVTDPMELSVAFIAGFVSYLGWDSLTMMSEEMKNPRRDLPLALCISMLTVTGLYLLTNVAYFTVLTPDEFAQSDAVAKAFADKSIPEVSWIIPVAVALSAAGSVNAIYLLFTRYALAGGKDGQFPEVFSHISIKYFTPLPSIGLQLIVSVFLSCATFIDLQALFLLLGVVDIFRKLLCLIALLYLKRWHPHLPKVVTVPWFIVGLCILFLVALVLCSVWMDPYVNGIGTAIFLLGLPIYFLVWLCAKSSITQSASETLTIFIQRLCKVVPSGKKEN